MTVKFVCDEDDGHVNVILDSYGNHFESEGYHPGLLVDLVRAALLLTSESAERVVLTYEPEGWVESATEWWEIETVAQLTIKIQQHGPDTPHQKILLFKGGCPLADFISAVVHAASEVKDEYERFYQDSYPKAELAQLKDFLISSR